MQLSNDENHIGKKLSFFHCQNSFWEKTQNCQNQPKTPETLQIFAEHTVQSTVQYVNFTLWFTLL